MLWAILFGVSLRLLEINIPWELDKSIQQLGAAAIPIALILLGMQLSETRFQPGIKEIILAIRPFGICADSCLWNW